MHRTRNILDRLLARIFVGKRQFVAHLVVSRARDTDAARFRETLQPRRDVYPVAVDLHTLDHHVAQVDADTELHLTLQRQLCILGSKRALNRNGTSNRLDHAGEFGQYAVTGRIDESPVVSFDERVSNLAAGG